MRNLIVAICFLMMLPMLTSSQVFVHPGGNQSLEDLLYMRKLVKENKSPWKEAFEQVKRETDIEFKVQPFVHVLRGPYAIPNIGGNELDKSAGMAYNCALLWYITQDKSYAKKAIEIINAWSDRLRSFDYNDAKLLAGWTGHVWCDAAEILRYSYSGWKKEDIDKFTEMLMTVYYPLLRFYFPKANGNWDAAIIHSILSIAVFIDNKKMFNDAVDHYLHGTVNGSLFKYIYTNGQCQESIRDQAHVQLGLGEFAGAAQVAWTQGIDLYSIGNNRLAEGLNYTAGFVLGHDPYCYGEISQRAKKLGDCYESVYSLYGKLAEDKFPFVKRAADSVRPKVPRSVLASVRSPQNCEKMSKILRASVADVRIKPGIFGAGAEKSEEIPLNAVFVSPGQSIQNALDSLAGSGRYIVLRNGVHKISQSLKIPSGIVLSGEGEGTVLFLDPRSKDRDAIVNGEDELHKVTIRDLVIECSNDVKLANDPNGNRSFNNKYDRGGILFRSQITNKMYDLTFINLTVRNSTYNGVSISGANNLRFFKCDFSENGSGIVPGPKLQHNLQLSHCDNILIKENRIVTSPYGSGVAIENCHNVEIVKNIIARNGYHGIVVLESEDIRITQNHLEANDGSGIRLESLYRGSKNLVIWDNDIQFNKEYGIKSDNSEQLEYKLNKLLGNGLFLGEIDGKNQVSIQK